MCLPWNQCAQQKLTAQFRNAREMPVDLQRCGKLSGVAPHHRTFVNVSPVGATPYQQWLDLPAFEMTEEQAKRLLAALGDQLRLDDPDLDYIIEALESMRMAWVDTTDPHAIRLAIAAGRHKAKLVTDHRADGTKPPRYPERNRWDQRRFNGGDRPTVYYMRLGNRCKIGFTLDVRKRTSQIQPEEVLATESGGLALEAQRHEQFKKQRVTGEWFRYEGDLVAHVEALRRASRTARSSL